MKGLWIAVGAMGLLIVSACAPLDEVLFDSVRNHERQKCGQMPQTEAQRCNERTQDDYDAYKKKRDEAKK